MQCGGKNIRFVVMNNLLPSSLQLHAKYDLKGSTHKRRASNHERTKLLPTYKDLDFMEQNAEGLLLDVETHEALKKTIERDCRVCFFITHQCHRTMLSITLIHQFSRSV